MGITIMLLSLSNLALIVIGWHFYVSGVKWQRRYPEAEDKINLLEAKFKKLNEEANRLAVERDELLRQKKSLTSQPVKAQHGTKRVSGAELRRIVGAENSRFMTQTERPNSEVLKENE